MGKWQGAMVEWGLMDYVRALQQIHDELFMEARESRWREVGEATRYLMETAVELIATAARRPEFATTEAGRQVVADRALASRVQVALATQPETRKYRITVEAQQGVVTLEATAALDQAVEVARTVHGVRDVKTRQVEIPPIPPFVA